MRQYLIESFLFNDKMNKQVLRRISELPDKDACVRFFSHLVNSQIRWLARIQQYPANPPLDWWLPVYPFEELETRWEKSLNEWINFLKMKSEEELYADADFIGYDGTHFVCPLKDIALQLNYHSIHHRAQIQMIIRQQGLEPDFIDYIGTKYKRAET